MVMGWPTLMLTDSLKSKRLGSVKRLGLLKSKMKGSVKPKGLPKLKPKYFLKYLLKYWHSDSEMLMDSVKSKPIQMHWDF